VATYTPQVSWAIAERWDSEYSLRNIGSDRATKVNIDEARTGGILKDVPTDADIEPGASVRFLIAGATGSSKPGEVFVTWEGGPGPVAVPVP